VATRAITTGADRAGPTNWVEEREHQRDEVHFRARGARDDGDELLLLVVNMSARGLMARCGANFAIGERVSVVLPVVGTMEAEVRWCLGGRAGFQFDAVIPLATYLGVLAAVVRN